MRPSAAHFMHCDYSEERMMASGGRGCPKEEWGVGESFFVWTLDSDLLTLYVVEIRT